MKFALKTEDTDLNDQPVVRTAEFEAMIWMEALDQFVLFLRANGFYVEPGEIAVPTKRAAYLDLTWVGSYDPPDANSEPAESVEVLPE